MPFIRRYRGGIYPTGKLPPCVRFVLFSYFAFPHDHQRPSQTTETVSNCFSGPSLDRRNVLCGERAVLHRFLRFSRALSLESSLSAHSCRLIKRKSTTSCLGRSFDHPFYSRPHVGSLDYRPPSQFPCHGDCLRRDSPTLLSTTLGSFITHAMVARNIIKP